MISGDSGGEIEREEARERGILSGPDRKWLLMDRDEFVEEHSRQYWGQRRDKVVERVQHGLIDLGLLFEHLEPDLYEEIFPMNREKVVEQQPHLERGLAFLMNGTGTAIRNVVRDTSYRFENSHFWDIFVGALERHGISNGVLVDDVDSPKIHGRLAPRIDKIIERAEAGEELTGGEIELLLQSDRVEKERVFEAISEAVKPEHQSE